MSRLMIDSPFKWWMPIPGVLWLGAVAFAVIFWLFLAGPPAPPKPNGNCSLWIKDAAPTFVCVDEGETSVWKLHPDGSWQNLGPATDSRLGVPKA